MRDVDHGGADLAMDALDLDLHLLAQILVERAQRLVEQEHIRIENEAARERDTLLLTAGQLARIPVGKAAEPHEIKHLVDARLHVPLGEAAHLQGKDHVLRRRHMREQRVVLEHDTDIALIGLAECEIVSSELDDPACRILESGNHQQRRRLAGAARPQECDEFSALDIDRDIVDGIALAVVRFDDVTQAKIGRRSHSPASGLSTINASTTTQPRPSGSAFIGLRSTSAMNGALRSAKAARA